MFVYGIENVDYLKDKETFMKGYNHVPAYRHARIDALKRDDAKRLSLGAELLLEKLLRENGFEDLADNRVGFYNGNGKPYIKRPGQHAYEQPPVHFSISHSRNIVMCALSDTPIGCDIEHSDTEKPNCNALALRFFPKEEALLVEKDKSAFYRLWTLKEAYAKCTETPLPVTLKKNMECLALENLKKEQGVIKDFVWSVVYYE